jgi:hypothetical protein
MLSPLMYLDGIYPDSHYYVLVQIRRLLGTYFNRSILVPESSLCMVKETGSKFMDDIYQVSCT